MLGAVDDLMPIGEFSDRSGLSAKRLRTYASEGLLVPAAIDPTSGYRYYSPGQVSHARVIDAFRKAGVPLADIGALVSQPTREALDAWSLRLQSEAVHRIEAFSAARSLLGVNEVVIVPSNIPNSKETPMNTLKMSGRTETGCVRKNNEDAIFSSGALALVADGMGGHPGGDIASKTAVDVVQAVFTGQSAEELEAAVRAANWAIHERAVAQPDLEGMGTTICVAGLLNDGSLGLVHVGDSRAYLWHQGELTQLTRDHSVTAELIERGELAVEEAREHSFYGVLTRALGVGPTVEIDRNTVALEAGDRVLICSDGLFNELSSVEISGFMSSDQTVGEVADNLINQAIASGGSDNVSVVIVELAA
jgi:serine/threonine protein phosphatase PrpC